MAQSRPGFFDLPNDMLEIITGSNYEGHHLRRLRLANRLTHQHKSLRLLEVRRRIVEKRLVAVVTRNDKSKSVVALDASGSAFAFGQGHSGNLAVGQILVCNPPREILLPGKIKQVIMPRKDLTLFRTESGEVYFSGRFKGELYSHDYLKYSASRPRKINGLENIVNIISPNDYNTFFLDHTGQVFTYLNWHIDYPDFGYYVISDLVAKQALPFKPKQIVIVKDYNHIYLLDDLGKLHGGDVYKLHDIRSAHLIQQLVNCDDDNIICISHTGEVLRLDKERRELVAVSLPAKIKQVISHAKLTYFVTCEGGVLTGKFHSSQFEEIEELNIIDLPARIDRIIKSLDALYFQTKTGQVLSYGKNDGNKLGLGNNISVATAPTLIPNLRDVTQVVTSSDNAYFVTSVGELSACGLNDNGQLGCKDVLVGLSEPRAIPFFAELAAQHRMKLMQDYKMSLDEIADESLRTQESSHAEFQQLFLQLMSLPRRDDVLLRSSSAAKKFAAIVNACDTSAAHSPLFFGSAVKWMPSLSKDEHTDVCRLMAAYIVALERFANSERDKLRLSYFKNKLVELQGIRVSVKFT